MQTHSGITSARERERELREREREISPKPAADQRARAAHEKLIKKRGDSGRKKPTIFYGIHHMGGGRGA